MLGQEPTAPYEQGTVAVSRVHVRDGSAGKPSSAHSNALNICGKESTTDRLWTFADGYIISNGSKARPVSTADDVLAIKCKEQSMSKSESNGKMTCTEMIESWCARAERSGSFVPLGFIREGSF